MKNCKSTESLCLTILTIYANDWSLFDMFIAVIFIYFFFEIPKYVEAKNGLIHLDWHFLEWASTLTKLIFKTSSRRLAKTSSRYIQDVFKTFWRRLPNVLKASSKRLQDIFKTSSRRIIKLKSLRSIQHVSETFFSKDDYRQRNMPR